MRLIGEEEAKRRGLDRLFYGSDPMVMEEPAAIVPGAVGDGGAAEREAALFSAFDEAAASGLTPERAREVMEHITFYPPMKHCYPASICGKACDTACYIHLEEKGVLKRKFRTPFRKREAWKLPLLPEPK